MKCLLLSAVLIIGISVLGSAQTVQWASSVIEVSSELTPVQYSARQALGKPNVLPAGGQSPNAWAPDRPNRKEFIKLGFANPINIRQIAIAESHNPSAIFKVYAYDEAGKEYLINTLNPRVVPLKGRILNLFMETTPYKVTAVKIEFDGAAVPDYYGIDAVAISDVNYPIIADIPVAQLIASGIVIEALDKNVNSEQSELNPLLSPDGKTLYFSRKNHPGNIGGVDDMEDIWYSELDSAGQWQLAKNMGPEFNNEGPNFVSSIQAITPDGKSAIMVLGNRYMPNGKITAGVSISSNESGSWGKPVPLKITNDYNLSEKANYFLSNNRMTLLMSVQREDSHGDRDLYVSFMNADSTWTEPKNLGDVINTAAEESAPFLASDNKTLYFSSKGFSGYGGSDIYMSRRLDDSWTNWSEPENLGPEINSPLEDLFFNIPANSEFAYYSRGVSEKNTDIFRIKLPILKNPEPWVTVSGKVIDNATQKPASARIVYERMPDGKAMGIAKSDPETGIYELRVAGGELYAMRAEGDGKISDRQELDLRKVQSDQLIREKNFKLGAANSPTMAGRPIQENVSVVLNTVSFDFNQAILKDESHFELDRIVDLMTKTPGMQIEISGHTDSVGNDQSNLRLSERRAKAVTDYLVKKGIERRRIKTTFFGSQRPVTTNETEVGRRSNRRVEFKILKLN